MALVEVNSLAKSYGDLEALRDVELEVNEGEVVGLIGPNGAGKSTAIKCITGQENRNSGSIAVLGIDPEKQPVQARENVGILPEREDPPSFLTGNEYLDYVSDIRDRDIEKKEWIERMRLGGKMDKLTLDLSKGERQKLMIVQAFFHKPELAFIDEPLINLDPRMQGEVKDIFREAKERGAGILISTHVVSMAEEICDRVYFIREGESQEVEGLENLSRKFDGEE